MIFFNQSLPQEESLISGRKHSFLQIFCHGRVFLPAFQFYDVNQAHTAVAQID
jgi:hypothetical protein